MISRISYSQNEKYSYSRISGKLAPDRNIVSAQSEPFDKFKSVPPSVSNVIYFNYIPKISFGTSSRKAAAATANRFGTYTEVSADALSGEDHYSQEGGYRSTADNLAALIGPDKNVVIEAEEDTSPELLIKQFTKRVKAEEYVGQGLSKESTIIKTLDLSDKTVYAMDFEKELKKISEGNKTKNKVVFLQHFERWALDLNKAGVRNINEHLINEYPNILFIGILPQKELEQLSSELQPSLGTLMFPRVAPETLNTMAHLDLKGLAPNVAVDFLLKNQRYLAALFERYKDYSIIMTPEALKEVVRRGSTGIKGASPNKDLRVIDILAAQKANQAAKEGKPKGTKIWIDKSDVDSLFEDNILQTAHLRPDKRAFQLVENVKERLSDVIFDEGIKDDLDDIISFANDPDAYIAKGGIPPKGVLFSGPPGNAKTLLARAIAGESNAPFIYASGSEFIEQFVGVGARRIRELKGAAVNAAIDSGKNVAIIFIDEIDAFGKQRTGDTNGSSESANTLNQLLTEMDGFNTKDSKVKIIWMAATNRKDVLDDALLSRFENNIMVKNPNTANRFKILALHAKKFQFEDDIEREKILKSAARFTEGMSGRDLKNIIDKAARIVARRNENKFITHNDMVEGYLRVEAGPISKLDEDIPITELEDTVRHEGRHALIMDTLKQSNISFITLDTRGDFAGAVFHHPPKITPDFKCIIMSGATSYAGSMSDTQSIKNAGASSDLINVTDLNMKAITKWGLGIYTPPVSTGMSADEGVLQDITSSKIVDDMFKSENKQDLILFSTTEQKIAKLVVDFHQGFLDEYVNIFRTNAGKGGSNLSGEGYSALRQTWLAKTRKIDAEKVLKKGCNAIIDIAFNSPQLLSLNKQVNVKDIFDREIDRIINISQNNVLSKGNNAFEYQDLLKRINAITEIVQNSGIALEGIRGINSEKRVQKAIQQVIMKTIRSLK